MSEDQGWSVVLKDGRCITGWRARAIIWVWHGLFILMGVGLGSLLP